MKIRWSVETLSDLETILEIAEEADPKIAANIIRRIKIAEKDILTFPQAAYYHQPSDTYERYISRTRVILIYHLEPEYIEIIAAFHTSRDPSKKSGHQ